MHRIVQLTCFADRALCLILAALVLSELLLR